MSGTPALCRNDNNIDFEWYEGSPAPQIQADNFSARWTRSLNFSTGTYRFVMFYDDGVRLYVDGVMVFQNWCSGCRQEDVVDVPLIAGAHEVKMEMRENAGWAAARLSWSQLATATPTATPTRTYTPTPTRTITPTPTPYSATRFAYLPLIVRAASSPWSNITTENFESGFPQAGWTTSDYGATSGMYYWGKRSCRISSGSFSGWGIGGGTHGVGLSCGSNYPNNSWSWLIYGPFNLTDATDAELLFDYWLNTEYNYDWLFVGASIDGNEFYGSYGTGNTNGWLSHSFDLTADHGIGSMLGRSNVWIGFVFMTDGSVTYPEGVYIDNIVLRKKVGSFPEQTEQATSDSACEAVLIDDYAWKPCTSLNIETPPTSDK